MTSARRSLVFAFSILTCVVAVRAQDTPDERDIERSPKREVAPRDARTVIGATIGLLPTYLNTREQLGPTLQFSAQRFITDRLAVGLAFGTSFSESSPYVDEVGVQSFVANRTRAYGGRMSGSILRSGPLELYGGIQLNVVTTEATYRHEFPKGLIEDEASYIASRPNPFGEARTQLGVVGFFGASVEVLPHVHALLELGNNLSLVSAGIEVRL